MLKWTKGASPYAYNTAAEPIKDSAPMPEKERLSLRKACKERMARLEIIEANRRAIEAESVGYDAELDRIASDHVADMEPLQAELRKLEESQVQSTIDRKPIDQTKDARRLQIIETIRLANATLQENLEAVRKKQAGIHERQMANFARMEGSSVSNERRKLIDLGSADLLDELFVAKLSFEDAVARCKRANRAIAEAAGDDIATRRWNGELASAGEARAAADLEQERIREAIAAE